MSFAVLGDLNWLAVFVAAVAYFAFGAVWFAQAVLGKAWQRSSGFEIPKGERPGPEFYIGPLITCLVATIAVAMLAEATGSNTLAEGIVLGVVAGVGISGAVLFVTGVFDPKKPEPLTWFGVAAGYHLVGLVIASAIVSVWT
jgi:Protein of unknown function (DUF1761)